ncbi:hypothetical protein M3Y98_00921600 [Aphelenchoides besseyi]|nr:hypothetical protein M3Y98_00921600 [Aphelenchoides besseyi]KAI6193430.1 hypothetical protein M3Y96_01016900 [Aphelenchoides besseyi]
MNFQSSSSMHDSFKSSRLNHSQYVPQSKPRPPTNNSGEYNPFRASKVRFNEEVQTFSPKRSREFVANYSNARSNLFDRSGRGSKFNGSKSQAQWLDKMFGGNRSKSFNPTASNCIKDANPNTCVFASSKGPFKSCLKHSKH